MSRRHFNHREEHDPVGMLSNLFDVAMVFAVHTTIPAKRNKAKRTVNSKRSSTSGNNFFTPQVPPLTIPKIQTPNRPVPCPKLRPGNH